MRIVVEQIVEEIADQTTEQTTDQTLSITLINFTAQCGGGIATWRGDVPEPGSSHEVELEIPNPLTWSADARSAQTAGANIRHGEGTTEITCRIEGEIENDLVLLRLDNSVLTAEISDHPEFSPGSWLQLTLPPANLELFPYLT